ncbi:NAD(P)-binding protein [Thozetella sp. PMI_491]|nr:NAD(P)-binding protein [Thozetella sp. PMI_491]
MSSSPKRSILITGCSPGGAGHALALEFAARGMRVFATARSTNSLQQLEAKGIEVLPLEVTSAQSIAALKEEITKRTGGKLDILFNNAGTMFETPAIEADPTRVRKMFDTNVFGVFDMVTAFTPLLLASVPDSKVPPTIINTSSVLGRLPYPFAAAYNATKAAVTSYSDTLRIELAPLGIKVVTLFMGEVSTGLMSADTISIGDDSLYVDVKGGLQGRTQHHVQNSIKPEDFARQVVNQVVSKAAAGKGEYLWLGTNATLVWLLDTLGWRKVFDQTMESGVGLDKTEIRKAIREKGLSSVRRD